MSERVTDSDCVACGKKIVEISEKQFDATTGSMIIGPGGKDQWHTTTAYHCSFCGLVYRFLPKKESVIYL